MCNVSPRSLLALIISVIATMLASTLRTCSSKYQHGFLRRRALSVESKPISMTQNLVSRSWIALSTAGFAVQLLDFFRATSGLYQTIFSGIGDFIVVWKLGVFGY